MDCSKIALLGTRGTAGFWVIEIASLFFVLELALGRGVEQNFGEGFRALVVGRML